MTIPLLIIVGIVSGIISGLLGVGGGTVLVPALVLIAGVQIHTAIGISLCVIVPTALAAAIKHYSYGHMDLKIAFIIIIGAVAGAYLGSCLANSVPAATLKRVFGAFLIIVGVSMAFGNKAPRPDASSAETIQSETT